MKMQVTVREYARLCTEPVTGSLDRAQVSASAFDWLCTLSESFSRSGASLVQVEGRRSLRLDNYVGVIETPCGTRLEILPKHFEDGDCEMQSRALLRRMIQRALGLPVRQVGAADLELFDAPLSEWVMGRFLQALDRLVKQGVRFGYRRVEEERRFLRGQLNMAAQVRQPPGRQHRFQIRHDLFQPDRPENRLVKLALERVWASTRDADNWRLAHELRSVLLEVPASRRVEEDFRAWSGHRLLAHYQPVKPWCELILNRHMPLAVSGHWRGISLLFPMERLFERYVEAWLRGALHADARLTTQASSRYLCEHKGGRMFQLQPDLLVRQEERQWVLDTKWKRLDGMDRAGKYGLSQSDFYQLFAYGQKYLGGKGEMVLIYPRRGVFTRSLPVFDFGGGLTLRVLPFDLETESLVDAEATTLPLRPSMPMHLRLDPQASHDLSNMLSVRVS